MQPDRPSHITVPDPQRLADALSSLGVQVAPQDIISLRGGRTNHVWMLRGRNRPDLVCKLSFSSDTNPLFPNFPEHEWRALCELSQSGLAPFPIARSSAFGGRLICYQAALGSVGSPEPHFLASALAALHGSDPWPDLPHRAHTPQHLLHQGEEMLLEAPFAVASLTRLKPAPRKVPDVTARLIHTDPVPANLVSTKDGIVFLDWQCPAIGDPCEDLVHAMSPAMQTLYGQGDGVSFDNDAFMEAYPDHSIRQRLREIRVFYHWRMACYCAWKTAKGNTEYAEALESELAVLREHPG